MILTGKAKQDFEEWLITHSNINCLIRNEFYSFPLSMQWGVYQDWFGSVGIPIDARERWKPNLGWVYIVKCQPHNGPMSRPEARTAAIIKATEIFNKSF